MPRRVGSAVPVTDAGAPIRLLHLESDTDDADRVAALLIAEGLGGPIERVSTRSDFAAALGQNYDAILAADGVPGLDGEAALALALERAPHIPFIFVSGTLDVDVAVDALKHGATDYVVKQRLERLPAVIRRAVRERAERAARHVAEEALRLATQAAQVGIWDYDPVHDVLRWDARCRALFGLRPGATIRYDDSFLAALHPGDRASVEAAAIAAMTPGGSGAYDIEYRVIGLEDGGERWISAQGAAHFEGGRAVRFVGTVIDITERKRAHAAVAASEEALRAESDALEILNRLSREIAAELDLEKLVQTVVNAGVTLAGAETGAFFYTILDAQGQAYQLYALSGAAASAFENFPMPRSTALFGPSFRGEGVVRLDDVQADPRYGSTGPHFGMPAGHPPVRSYMAVPVSLRSGEVVGCLFFGHAQPGRFSLRIERLAVGLAAQAAVGIENARLFQSAQRLNQTLEEQVAARTAERDRIWQVSADLLGVADGEGRWISINPAWTRLLGWEADEIIGRTGEWMRHPDDRAQTAAEARKLFAGEITTSFENRLRTRSGDYRTFNWRAVPFDGEIYAVARDITAQVEQAAALAEAEEGLRQSQKMEALGQLTGGVAHDFNNLLQIVIGNLDMLKRHLPDDPPRLRRAAENASAGAERAATLTQRLLAFARRQPLAPSPVAPDRLVEGMIELLHRTLGETIRVETTFASGEWMVEVDPNQLESALLNLAINARDAMQGGGTLTIAVDHLSLDSPISGQSEVPAGDHVVIAVSDSGEGMAPEVVARVFEPFFTTKDVGKGTGLGLSMVYGFVKQSGGHVHIASRVGESTAVRIYLPRLLACGTAVANVPDAGEGSGGGSETILVCEDDDGVRANSVESLRELGYAVLEAADARAALRLLDGDDTVDLLFTDVILPGGMTGSDLAAQARGRRPDLRVLFTSGYARDAIVHHGRLDPGVELLPKPFAFEELAMRVRRMLDG
ncbi:PAS domain-containing protein [Sphingomonas abietis]|uniref:histidine kinase n=1 Tax=Sphingomonas abietis TaxID=3012344 RepID=A0ABY7NKI8_9SPHN|nr:PAS domain-containing protein [Sphingomonas abietis]WBO22044.1 PAS domain-containing protein [Sphingomonas abietis]